MKGNVNIKLCVLCKTLIIYILLIAWIHLALLQAWNGKLQGSEMSWQCRTVPYNIKLTLGVSVSHMSCTNVLYISNSDLTCYLVYWRHSKHWKIYLCEKKSREKAYRKLVCNTEWCTERGCLNYNTNAYNTK